MLIQSLLLSLLACAPLRHAPNAAVTAPTHTEVRLLRTGEDGPRIYVQATLPNGDRGLFLVDTGADISVLSKETAERLGLVVKNTSNIVSGLSGQAPLKRAVMPSLSLGQATLRDVSFAVDVPGVPDRAGGMRQDGILGNNIWEHFLLEIDYPANLMVLHQPDSFHMPRHASPMVYDGFVNTIISLNPGQAHSANLLIQVDTGASDLLFIGPNEQLSSQGEVTEGLEPLYGIGGSSDLPPSHFLHKTRHLAIKSVAIGGVQQDLEFQARWVNFEGHNFGPSQLKGLIGHELLSPYRLLIDYSGGEIALTPSRRKTHPSDGHRVLLQQLGSAHPSEDEAFLLAGLGQHDEAILSATQWLSAHPEALQTRLLLAELHRSNGSFDEARSLIESLSTEELVDERQLLSTVNGLILSDNKDRAITLAQEATALRPNAVHAWLSLSDALFLTQQSGAEQALRRARALTNDPNAFLIRRAQLAAASGDLAGARAHLRKNLQIYPFHGPSIWFYALLSEASQSGAFLHDLKRAMLRLHPESRPLDFEVAALHHLKEDDQARDLMAQGIERDCAPLSEPASTKNCLAWYYALGGTRPDESLSLVNAALKEDGPRSDFLDTKAIVHLSRGELKDAYSAARQSAQLAPSDIYMLWQMQRIKRMLLQSRR